MVWFIDPIVETNLYLQDLCHLCIIANLFERDKFAMAWVNVKNLLRKQTKTAYRSFIMTVNIKWIGTKK